MQRPLFLCLIGLVLGEAAAISMGWKGGLISVLFFCMAGFLIWKMSEKQNRFFIFTKAQCRSVFCIFLIFYAIGFILFLSEIQRNFTSFTKTRCLLKMQSLI